MGITRATMPLLSTLAALVLIVHSMDEDLDSEYSRHELRPRAVDSEIHSFEQPWRAVESDKIAEKWNQKRDETQPKRRRPGRKRKRRPELTPEETVAEPRYQQSDHQPSPAFMDIENTGIVKTARRRRKKQEIQPTFENEHGDQERPLRRRLRRKRPSLDIWPRLSEFGHGANDNKEKFKKAEYDLDDDNKDAMRNSHLVEDDMNEDPRKSHLTGDIENDGEESSETVFPTDEDLADAKNQDKSLSEFSVEMFRPLKKPVLDQAAADEQEKPIDPVTLKEILRKSNGTSLSEILQQHNLSLADLLHGKENAISILKSDDLSEKHRNTLTSNKEDTSVDNYDSKPLLIKHIKTVEIESDMKKSDSEISLFAPEFTTNYPDRNIDEHTVNITDNPEIILDNTEVTEHTPKLVTIRHLPTLVHRKLRLRPMRNGTFKGKINKDFASLHTRRFLDRRNKTKSREWRDIIPKMLSHTSDSNQPAKMNIITEVIPTSTTEEIEETTTLFISPEVHSVTEIINENTSTDMPKTSSEYEETTTEIVTTSEKPTVVLLTKPAYNISSQRRLNRLKKKRIRQKNYSTETETTSITSSSVPNTESLQAFILPNTQSTPINNDEKLFTSLENVIVSEKPVKNEYNGRGTRVYTTRSTTSRAKPTQSVETTTEEAAKIEIEEILNDTRTSAKLSRILMERNMTLSELVEHRERGSSHVHLADIFHNASKEPNPPEPFLSKSLLEPISKETYPLRALLEGNPTAKSTTVEPNPTEAHYVDIPVVMDFGNNVNENSENMGIISLFKNFTKSDINTERSVDEINMSTLTINNNNTKLNESRERESRILKEGDMVTWNDIFDLMDKNHNQTSTIETLSKELKEPFKKISLEDDTDGDGVIVLEDLQNLKDFDSNIASASEERLEVNMYEKTGANLHSPGILDRPNNAKSVTVATASIIGLALIVFLLTYALFKCKQQRSAQSKSKAFCNDQIPTPVFESRKGNKNNCSSRSISPMLSSNIYTMNTLDSRNGKESPDYMWESLRKPFQ